jgi:hypothetical protein
MASVILLVTEVLLTFGVSAENVFRAEESPSVHGHTTAFASGAGAKRWPSVLPYRLKVTRAGMSKD